MREITGRKKRRVHVKRGQTYPTLLLTYICSPPPLCLYPTFKDLPPESNPQPQRLGHTQREKPDQLTELQSVSSEDSQGLMITSEYLIITHMHTR